MAVDIPIDEQMSNNSENWFGLTVDDKIVKNLVYLIIYSTASLAAVGGNGVVIYLIINFRRMRSVTDLFILNLAVGDLLMAILCIPFTFTSNLLFRYWPFGSIMCRVVSYAQAVCVFISAYTLVAISIDRYIAIIYPLRPRMTKRHSQYLVAFIWLVALLTPLPTALLSRLMLQTTSPSTDLNDQINSTTITISTSPSPITKNYHHYDYSTSIQTTKSQAKNLFQSTTITTKDLYSTTKSSSSPSSPSPFYTASSPLPLIVSPITKSVQVNLYQSTDSSALTTATTTMLRHHQSSKRNLVDKKRYMETNHHHHNHHPNNNNNQSDPAVLLTTVTTLASAVHEDEYHRHHHQSRNRIQKDQQKHTTPSSNVDSVDELFICNEDWNENNELKSYYSVMLMLLQYILPFTVLVFTYSRIGLMIWGRQTPGEAHGGRDARIAASKRKMVKMMITCVVAFTLCWLPLNIFNVIVDRYPETLQYEYIEYIWVACHWLAMSHASYNPFIYIWMNQRFRNGFRYVIKRFCCCGCHHSHIHHPDDLAALDHHHQNRRNGKRRGCGGGGGSGAAGGGHMGSSPNQSYNPNNPCVASFAMTELHSRSINDEIIEKIDCTNKTEPITLQSLRQPGDAMAAITKTTHNNLNNNDNNTKNNPKSRKKIGLMVLCSSPNGTKLKDSSKLTAAVTNKNLQLKQPEHDNNKNSINQNPNNSNDNNKNDDNNNSSSSSSSFENCFKNNKPNHHQRQEQLKRLGQYNCSTILNYHYNASNNIILSNGIQNNSRITNNPTNKDSCNNNKKNIYHQFDINEKK